MRKLRTRQHIIEDLGYNHAERVILYAGYTINRYGQNDYGYDGMITTFNEKGEVDYTQMNMQLKSTDNIKQTSDKLFYLVDISKRDLQLWCYCDVTVILILYDAQKERAFYINILDLY